MVYNCFGGWLKGAGVLFCKSSVVSCSKMFLQGFEEEINVTLQAYPGNKQIEKQATSPAYHNYIEDVIANRKTIKKLTDLISNKSEEK